MSNLSSGYTGITSASFTTPTAKELQNQKQFEKQKRQQKRLETQPLAEPVQELIDKYKAKVSHVTAVTTKTHMTDKEAGEVLRSARANYVFIESFEADLKLILKEYRL